MIYADIRGFTKKFKEDGSNLPEMSKKTVDILTKMYETVINRTGSHVQFQGDRESALRNRYGDTDYVYDGLIISMDLLDKIQESGLDLHIGIGCSYGTVFAARIGFKNRKHNIILGEAVNEANTAEDEFADEDQIAITGEMYRYVLKVFNGKYKLEFENIFTKKENYYVTTCGLKKWRSRIDDIQSKKSSIEAKKDSSYKPWSIE